MKKALYLLTFLSVSLCFSQQSKIDSLKFELRQVNNDSLKMETLLKIVRFYYRNNIKEGLVYADSLQKLSKKNNSFENLCTSYRYFGNYYTRKGEFDKANKLFIKSLKVNDSINFYSGKYSDYASIGGVYKYDKKYDSAKFYYQKAIEVVEKNKIKGKYTSAYGNLANIYFESNEPNFKIAIEYYTKAIDSSKHLKTKRRVITIYTNLGTVFLDMMNYKKAEDYLKLGLKFSEELNYKTGIADNSLKLSETYLKSNTKLIEVQPLLEKSVEIYKDLGDDLYLIDAYINLGDLYSKTNQIKKSIVIKKEAIKLSKKNKLNDYLYNATVSISESYYENKQYELSLNSVNSILKDTADSKMISKVKFTLFDLKSKLEYKNHNYKGAYYFSNLLNDEKNKVFGVENLKNINEIETKYQTEKKEKENLQLKADNVEQELATTNANKQKWIFGIGLVMSLLALSVFAFYYRKNKKQKTLIENLQKELHHRIKNNLSVIDTFIEVAKEEFSNTAFNTKLTELQNRIESINEVHVQLYKNSDVTTLDVKQYIEKLAHNVAQSFSQQNISVTQNISDSFTIKADKSFPIGLIVNEFLTNSYKYAFNNDQGAITISIQDTGATYELSLSDNGKGLLNDFDIETTSSFGMRIMKLLSQELNGTFQLKSDNGVHLNIQFPK